MTNLLAQPLALGAGRQLPNRIAKSAMSERMAAPDGEPSSGLVQLYRTWAEGGTGLLITGNVMIDRRARGESGNVCLEDDRHHASFRAWAQASQCGGGLVWMQLNHPGRQAPRFLTRETVAPSAVAMKGTWGVFRKPRALTASEIEETIERFVTSSRLAKAAGFDGVQIHAAHGYLISQFLSPRTNRREDAWGGNAINRRRFLLEIVRRTRAAVGSSWSIGVKFNSADFQRGGFDEEESMALVKALEEAGVDLLEISGGTYESAVMFGEEAPQRASTRKREAFFIDYAEKVRAVARLPLMVTGGFRSLKGMNEALSEGAVDVIGMARPLAVEPDLSSRLLDGSSQAAQTVTLSTGNKSLDSLVQASWYQTQMRHIAKGAAPSASLSRAKGVLSYVLPRGREDAAAG